MRDRGSSSIYSSSRDLDYSDSGSASDSSDQQIESTLERFESTLDKTEKSSSYELNTDVYSALLVSIMHREGEHSYNKILRLWPCALSLFCLFTQVGVIYAVQNHVERIMLRGLVTIVQNELVMLSFSNKTVPKGIYESICGTYEQYTLEPPALGSTVPLPSGNIMSPVFFFAKMPEWTWASTELGFDKSLLDRYRYVVDEGYFGWVQGYLWLFMLMIFIFTCTMLMELRQILDMVLMLCGFKNEKAFQGKDRVEFDNDKNKWIVKGISTHTRCIGYLIELLRFCVCWYVFWEGIRFLVYTTEKIDLILNSLALAFILEIDTILFKAIIAKTQQNFITNMEPIFYRTPIPTAQKCARFLTAPSLFLVGAFVAYSARFLQIHMFNMFFNDAAALCLFAGPTLDSSVMAPVPGFCESVMQITCGKQLPSPRSVLDKDYCVITDFDTPWPKNIRKASTESVWPESLFACPAGAPTNGTLPVHTECYANGADLWTWSRTLDDADHPWMAKFSSSQTYYTEVLQRVCSAMFDHGAKPREVEVDDDTGERMVVAPFVCRKESGIFSYFSNFSYTNTRNGFLWRRNIRKGKWLNLFGRCENLAASLKKCHVPPA